jgi:hypothetical protein
MSRYQTRLHSKSLSTQVHTNSSRSITNEKSGYRTIVTAGDGSSNRHACIVTIFTYFY